MPALNLPITRLSPAIVWTAAIACAAFLYLPVALVDPNVFDEGFIVTGAMMVRNGDLPLRDFYSLYGPAQYYVIAALLALFGEDLLVVRVAQAFTVAALGAVVYGCSVVAAQGRRTAATVGTAVFAMVAVFGNPSAGYPALPATLLLMLASLAFGLRVPEQGRAHLVVAPVLIGVAGLFRWDFGVFGLVALSVAITLPLLAQRNNPGGIRRHLLWTLFPCVGLMAVAYLPLIAAAGAHRWYEEVLHYSLFEVREWRNLELLRPSYWGMIRAWQRGDVLGLYRYATQLAFAIVPFASIGLGILVTVKKVITAKGEVDRATLITLGLSLTGLLLLNQMRVRPTMWQGFPAFTVAVPIATYLLFDLQRRFPLPSTVKQLGITAAMGCTAVLITVALGSYMKATAGPRIGDVVPRAASLRVSGDRLQYADWVEYGRMVRYIRDATRPDEVIFSGVTDTSRLFINDVLIYFLADRRPAVRLAEMEPGIANTERGQMEIVDALERQNARLVVLWNMKVGEPNRTAKSNAIHTLDTFVTKNFDEKARFGAYVILARKP